MDVPGSIFGNNLYTPPENNFRIGFLLLLLYHRCHNIWDNWTTFFFSIHTTIVLQKKKQFFKLCLLATMRNRFIYKTNVFKSHGSTSLNDDDILIRHGTSFFFFLRLYSCSITGYTLQNSVKIYMMLF